ncbi:25S rRNA (cytosine(2870)-C(5))-methyltransferase [Trifolium repens]|nr:25S rRNA (cytosine(2870)-C(5))-methyltransferase [Trifolium repens]
MVLMAAKVSQWAKRSKKYAGRFSSSSKRSSATKDKKEEQSKCFKCNKPGHFIADCPENKSRSNKQNSNKERYKNKVKKNFLATWEELDKDSDSDEDEEANLALMATAFDKDNSEHELVEENNPLQASDNEEEVIAKLSKDELVDSLKYALKLLTKKAGECKVLKKAYNNLTEKANIIVEENESLKSSNCFLETHYVYDDKVPPEHEFVLQEFLINGMKRSKIASLIYHVSRNRGEGLGYSRFNENNPLQASCTNKTSSDPKVIFVQGNSENLDISEPEMTSEPHEIESEVLKLSEPQTSKPEVKVKSKSKKTVAKVL